MQFEGGASIRSSSCSSKAQLALKVEAAFEMSSSQNVSEPTKPSLQEPLLVKPELPADQKVEPASEQSVPAAVTSSADSSSTTSSGSILNGGTRATVESGDSHGIELSKQSSGSTTSEPQLVINSDGRKLSVHWLDQSTSYHQSMTHSESFTSTSQLVTEEQDSRNEKPIKDKYEESALYIREGEDDAKFYHHPEGIWAKRVYTILHYQLYYVLHFSICILLLLLAFAETPSVGDSMLDENQKKTLVSFHGVLELVFLSLLGVNVILHLIWFRSNFIRHRILLIAIVLAVMYVEALTVVIRQQNHIRITRILRPLFLLDTHYMKDVRRVARQILQITKPILDVLLLLIFFILLFALFGYLIFAETDPDYYRNFGKSFISLFITATTANNPDVMMESYGQQAATPIFYVIYLIVTLYFASNVLLAVVYASFSEVDKKKFKKLFGHKRDALLRAFHVLSSDTISDTRQIQFHDFLLLMQHYRPRMPEWQVMCVFKSLNQDPNNQYRGLKVEDFERFYEVLDFRWSELTKGNDKLQWYSNYHRYIAKPLDYIRRMVSHRFYKFCIGLVVLFNLIFLIVYAHHIEDAAERYNEFQKVLPGTFLFLSIYIIDIILNIAGYGPYDYFRKFWSVADVTVISVSLIAAYVNLYHAAWAIILPLKLLRLIRLKRRYRDLMNTMVDLAPRLISVLVLILIIYYCFAIIGMEFLFQKVEQGCCKDALYNVGTYFKDNISVSNSTSPSENVYYLNNFDNILRSYATLFILMVVNNWYIIMEGFVSEVHPKTRGLTRLYFMMFYIITLVVLQVIIAFIVEAFVLKIQATVKRRTCQRHPGKKHCGCPDVGLEKKKKIYITLVEEDLAKIKYERGYMDFYYKGPKNRPNQYVRRWRQNHFNLAGREEVKLVGSRSHTKEDIHQIHYKDEILQWRKEKSLDLFRRRSSFELDQLRQFKNKTNIRRLCTKLGKNVIDFIMD